MELSLGWMRGIPPKAKFERNNFREFGSNHPAPDVAHPIYSPSEKSTPLSFIIACDVPAPYAELYKCVHVRVSNLRTGWRVAGGPES